MKRLLALLLVLALVGTGCSAPTPQEEEPSPEAPTDGSVPPDDTYVWNDWPSGWTDVDFGSFGAVFVKEDPQVVAALTKQKVYDLSDGWATIALSGGDYDSYYSYDYYYNEESGEDIAQTLSAQTEAPVLCASLYEGQFYSLVLYRNGKELSRHEPPNAWSARARRGSLKHFADAFELSRDEIDRLKEAFSADVNRAPVLIGEVLGCATTSSRMRAVYNLSPIFPEIPSDRQFAVEAVLRSEIFHEESYRYSALDYGAALPAMGYASGHFSDGGVYLVRIDGLVYRAEADGTLRELPGLSSIPEESSHFYLGSPYLIGNEHWSATYRSREFPSWNTPYYSSYAPFLPTKDVAAGIEEPEEADGEELAEADESEKLAAARPKSQLLTLVDGSGKSRQLELPYEAPAPLLLLEDRILTTYDESGYGYYPDHIACWSLEDGSLLWRAPYPEGDYVSLRTWPVYHGGEIILGYSDNYLYRYTIDGELTLKAPFKPGLSESSSSWSRLFPCGDLLALYYSGYVLEEGPYYSGEAKGEEPGYFGDSGADSPLRGVAAEPIPVDEEEGWDEWYNDWYGDSLSTYVYELAFFGVDLEPQTISIPTEYSYSYSSVPVESAVEQENGTLYFPVNGQVYCVDPAKKEIARTLELPYSDASFLGVSRGTGPIVRISPQVLQVYSRDLQRMGRIELTGTIEYIFQNENGNCCVVTSSQKSWWPGTKNAVRIYEIKAS